MKTRTVKVSELNLRDMSYFSLCQLQSMGAINASMHMHAPNAIVAIDSLGNVWHPDFPGRKINTLSPADYCKAQFS